jgi:hypothetical protein
MFLSPEVAIVQHSTGVMQVTWDYFENGITFFTNMVYTAIRFSIGSGEVAPFVGHNAFLRWQAVQDVGVVEPDGYIAYWSESHVSEDFDIALRLQIKGSIVRVASYHGVGFQEGVSLTIYDEIARWQKYVHQLVQVGHAHTNQLFRANHQICLRRQRNDLPPTSPMAHQGSLHSAVLHVPRLEHYLFVENIHFRLHVFL